MLKMTRLIFFLFIGSLLSSQTPSDTTQVDYQKRFTQRLNYYIKKQATNEPLYAIENETFLIEMTQHIIDNVKFRHPKYKLAKTDYFKSVETQLNRINLIILRLRKNGVVDLAVFARELRDKIKSTLKNQQLEYRLDEFYERSIQLILIAEKAAMSNQADYAKLNDLLNQNLYEVSKEAPKKDQKESVSLMTLLDEKGRSDFVKYNVSIGYIEKYQRKLMKTGSEEENLILARDLFERGLYHFNDNSFWLSSRILKNLLTTYTFLNSTGIVDYYLALSLFYSNEYSEALYWLEKVKGSDQVDQLILMCLADVYYVKQNFNGIAEVALLFNKSKPNITVKDNLVQNMFYLKVIRLLFLGEQYESVIKVAETVPKTNVYYYDTQFFNHLAEYALGKNSAISQLTSYLNNPDVPLDLHYKTRMKLAQIKFDGGEFKPALDLLAGINPNDYSEEEEFLLTKAWSLYFYTITHSDSLVQDFTEVKGYIQKLMADFPLSDYITEARSLMGYIKKLEDNLMGAESEYRYVLELKTYKSLSDELLAEEDSLKDVREHLISDMKAAIHKGQLETFKQYDDLLFSVDTLLYKLRYSDFSSVNVASYKDISEIKKLIQYFEDLQVRAEKYNDEKLNVRIAQNLQRLYRLINLAKVNQTVPLFGYNYFYDHAFARKASKTEYTNNKRNTLKQQLALEKDTLDLKIQVLTQKRAEFKENRKFKDLTKIDLSLRRLKHSKARLDYVETYAHQQVPPKIGGHLDYWSNYTAYELSNVQYVQKKRIEEENTEISQMVKNINQLFKDRNIVIDQRVKRIEKTILLMNQRLERERRINEREKNKALFETEFFDESTTEVDEDSLRNQLENDATRLRSGRGLDSLKNDSTRSTSMPPSPSQEKLPENDLQPTAAQLKPKED